jgi:hypothetical protein
LRGACAFYFYLQDLLGTGGDLRYGGRVGSATG